ncbi:uncharacterized protein LOC131671498 [Phymastichus coffea]|uniref:uncharacterized protein LOC131671498 n=1 Tax=Phymastichus coffea TaxID=108790 RepID=UPI00273B8DBF|nr:uncharacterized protein LOC131671498 [Phymastichus coffea]
MKSMRKDDTANQNDLLKDSVDENRAHLNRLCKCDRILSEHEIPDLAEKTKLYYGDKKFDLGADHCNDDIEAEYRKLIERLDLPKETYSMTIIETKFPKCLNFGVRSGTTHMNMQKFSPLSRGYQGPAIAVAAIATSFLIKPECWNEAVIDQVVEDGDSFYNNSYQHLKIDDRRAVTLQHLQPHLNIRNAHRATVQINDPLYAGTFRSERPQDLHVAKALELLFQKQDICVLTSPVLNVAIWKCCRHFNIFDAQPRFDDVEIDDSNTEGTAKLIFVENMAGVLFIILEKSGVQNESYVLHKVSVSSVKELSAIPEEPEQVLGPATLPADGYSIPETFRAVVRGTYHAYHPNIPKEFHGRNHLVLALAAIVYSKLLSANKWTKFMIDLIVNQSNIYLTDLARVLGKRLDDSFEMSVSELLCDVVLGVYTAKIKLTENVVPGEGKKGKTTVNVGTRDFFNGNAAGILELKNTFYAIWKENNKYYLLDPFACDEEGFRVDPTDPDEAARYNKAACCVTMNSSINQLLEILLENTETKDKDPFFIHGVSVLYVKAGIASDASDEKVVYREKDTNRRPQPPPSPPSTVVDECVTVVKPHPIPRPRDALVDYVAQYPELMSQVELFMDTFDNADKDKLNEDDIGYEIANPHRLILSATRNCVDAGFHEPSKGRQGLIIGLTAMVKARLKNEADWTHRDVDQIIIEGNAVYGKIVAWIFDGSEGDPFEETDEDQEEASRSKQEELSETFVSASRMSDSIFIRGLNNIEFSMLPEKIKILDEYIRLSWQISVLEGEANPLANLGEALEKYFDTFNEMLLENNKLMYAVWLQSDKYFVFNPYGNDCDGWRNITEAATLFVVDSINELVNLLYGLFEFNDYYFKCHYVKLRFQSDENNESNSVENGSTIESFEKFKIKFLPITEDNLNDMKPDDLKNEAIHETTIEDEETEVNNETNSAYEAKSLTQDLENLFKDVAETEQGETPERLNLALVTGIVKIEDSTENQEYQEHQNVYYEKLKYKHPPPFVIPPAKNLCNLLDIKLASKSRHSLLSRFSIDSRLAMKEKEDISDVTISTVDKSKLINLPRKKYFFSKSLPDGLTPIRAVDEQYIHDKIAEEVLEEECKRKQKEKEIEMIAQVVPDAPTDCILPSIIPVGPCIMTPKFNPKPRACPEKQEKRCSLSEKQQEDVVLRKLVCSTENLLLELVVPEAQETPEECPKTDKCAEVGEPDDGQVDGKCSEIRGFGKTDDENVGIILASKCLQDRETIESCHYKSCYFSAILCVLAKINVDVTEFHGGFLDRMIVATNKISDVTGKFRYKMMRCFRNFNILGARCNVILRQTRYADPDNYEPDALEFLLPSFLDKNQTGILVFGNVAYAFWTANGIYYLFDPYSCDENGRAAPGGQACLMEICDFDTFINRIIENTGEATCQSYRLYTIAISHLEQIKKRKPRRKKKSCCELPVEDDQPSYADECCPPELEKSESETSLIESSDWVKNDITEIPTYDGACPGFTPIKNYNASAIEVEILENDITRPIMAPFKLDENCKPSRQIPYDRKFFENSVLAEPMDLCVMAWAQIYEPPAWSTKTMQALFEASREYAFDSLLTAEDTTVTKMCDDVLTEFNIANYNFRAVFAPMHAGVLYADEGWNLAMSLEKIFGSTVYTGAIIVCGDAHIGVMKNRDKYYAWWLLDRTKNIRMVVSDDMVHYLKLIVKEIGQPEEVDFKIRIITISYTKIYGPDCSDLDGLHESMMPSSSLAKIHVNDQENDFDAVFRPINCPKKPLLIFGSVALNERDTVTEPYVKRCYFVAVFAVMLKRDIIQNPLPGMVDKVLELAECIYKLCEQPKYHTEHILKDVCLLGRAFELRDCASQLICLQGQVDMNDKNFIAIVKKHLERHLKKSTSGVIHFSNCCYGFWYSRAKCCYYYLDPYYCDENGKRVHLRGKSCLFMFPSICEMVKQMCLNNFEETTGFFIHQIHVESVDSSACPKFQEDPVWIYLDNHWSYNHVSKQNAPKKKTKELETPKEVKKPMFKNYLIEIPNSIYSIWGTLSTFDTKFGLHAGKNQVAICIAALAMQNLCHPSMWSTSVLDSAVICGHSYYKDSQKIPLQSRNQFSLTDCLKITPYFWDLEFSSDMCGVLYCSTDQPNLAETMENAFKRFENLLLHCNKKFVALLKTSEAFYVIDASWTGPPLFSENHGAIYAIRTRNLNMLVYVVTKILNTNYRLEFAITPVNLFFKQDDWQPSDSNSKISRKKLLDKPARQSPGTTINHACLVNGCDAVPDEDSYLLYSKHLKLGLSRGLELECAPDLLLETVSTKKICGRRRPQSCCAPKPGTKLTKSISSILNKTVGYPKILNLIKNIPDECFPQRGKTHPKIACGPKKDSIIDEKIEKVRGSCQTKKEIDVRSSFIYEEEREMFHKYNAELKKDIYHNYKHGQKEFKKMTSTLLSSTMIGSASAEFSVFSQCSEQMEEEPEESNIQE